MPKNKPIHITYIGRLETEKGIELTIDCIERWMQEERNIVWHICGNGSFFYKFQELEKYEKLDIRIYWHVNKQKIDEVLSMTDLVLMPSLFLETFGLVALETLSAWVPVCGFARGGLIDFIHSSLVLDTIDPISSFFRILDIWEFPVLDVSRFSYDIWLDTLRALTEWVDRILLVSDYTSIVWWAEQYVHDLTVSLRSIGKEVEIYGYRGDPSRLTRIWLMYIAPFAFWRGILLSNIIKRYQPDLIWMHSVLRYIWPHWVRVITNSRCKKYLTHHDIGLITPRPSQVYSESDIPSSSSLGDWVSHGGINIFTILSVTTKWLMISSIWFFLRQNAIIHILPSLWMRPFFQKYIATPLIIFPHTGKNIDPVKQ
jgi:hypothetical protein